MSNHNEQAGNTGLTDVERELSQNVDDDGNPRAIEEAAPPAAAAENPPAGDPPAAEPPVVPPVEAPVAVADQGSAVPFPTVQPGAARDFKAELASLKAQYGAGDVDDEAYEEQREQIIHDRAKLEMRQELAQEFAEQAWTTNVNAFLARQENAVLLRSPHIQQLWNTMMQTAVNTAAQAGTPITDDWVMMRAGRDLLFQELGLSSTEVPAAPPPAPPRPDQSPPLSNVPPTLSGVPAAAPSGAKVTADSLVASADVTEIERVTAGLSDAQWDELLRGTPGAFID